MYIAPVPAVAWFQDCRKIST
uniref:Uncharacterized protein n=1 Tax=Arundo donax TaxID=35708 RepID=A0A0A9AD69_ARUDO